jgi:hypothetical protein
MLPYVNCQELTRACVGDSGRRRSRMAVVRSLLVDSLNVQVSGGELDILFRHVVENPKISAIEILPTGN